MKLRPLGKWILIKPAKQRKKTKGGIHLVGFDKSAPPIGKVIKIGDDVRDVGIGETVIYPSHAVPEYRDEKEVILIKESELLGVLE